MQKSIAIILLASLAMAGLVQADLPPAGLNCHRSCYTLDLAKALPIKQALFKACKVVGKVVIKGARRRDPKKPASNRSQANAWGCGSVIEYKFSGPTGPKALTAYQSCEHSAPLYISKLQPYKLSLPPGPPRDWRC